MSFKILTITQDVSLFSIEHFTAAAKTGNCQSRWKLFIESNQGRQEEGNSVFETLY